MGGSGGGKGGRPGDAAADAEEDPSEPEAGEAAAKLESAAVPLAGDGRSVDCVTLGVGGAPLLAAPARVASGDTVAVFVGSDPPLAASCGAGNGGALAPRPASGARGDFLTRGGRCDCRVMSTPVCCLACQ